MATEQQPALPDGQGEPESKPFPYGDILRDIAKEWNKAETAIKRSEQVVGDPSMPAVIELRYAGRRLIDALDAAHHGGNNDKIIALLEDSRFCCYRAQHDAIDAAFAKIGIDLDALTEKLGFEAVISAYSEFREFYADFTTARSRIAKSRGERNNRNEIYESLTRVDLPNLADRFERLMAVRPIAKRAALKQKLGGVWGAIIGVATLAAAIFAGLAVDWTKYL